MQQWHHLRVQRSSTSLGGQKAHKNPKNACMKAVINLKTRHSYSQWDFQRSEERTKTTNKSKTTDREQRPNIHTKVNERQTNIRDPKTEARDRRQRTKTTKKSEIIDREQRPKPKFRDHRQLCKKERQGKKHAKGKLSQTVDKDHKKGPRTLTKVSTDKGLGTDKGRRPHTKYKDNKQVKGRWQRTETTDKDRQTESD